MWQERLATSPALSIWLPVWTARYWASGMDVAQRPRRSHVADFGICVARSGKTAALPAL
jgi:hypothetical protein